MIKEKIILIEYKDVLKQIENQEAHLLLGNGFNRGLGIDTSYKAIFKKMIGNDKGIYRDVEELVKECEYDLELFIDKLVQDINKENIFLRNYVKNKIRFDFMKATHEIVKSEVKNIYAEKNEGIYMLLKNFSNYFTLNFDSFLYLLLLNFKPIDDKKNEKSIIFQPKLKFIEEHLNETQNNIYSEIKEARTNGELSIILNGEHIKKDFNKLTKTHFSTEIKEWAKGKKSWKAKDINRVIDTLWEEENNNQKISSINDGAKAQKLFDDVEYVFNTDIDIRNETQNLFFLHGAFHIYRDGEFIKKITQKNDEALYDRLEEILNNEEKDIVCVFQPENKLDEINKNKYLRKSYNQLSVISGIMVIIGCSLSENDQHIYNQINESGVHTLYVSTTEKSTKKNYKRLKELFPNKNIYMFNVESISYELPDL